MRRNSAAATRLTGATAHKPRSRPEDGRQTTRANLRQARCRESHRGGRWHRRPRAGAIRELIGSAVEKRVDFLEYDPQTSSGAPNNTAALPGAAEQQLKSIWQLGLPRYLEACSAGGVVYNSAINNRSFRINNQFGHGISLRRPYTCEPSRIHRRSSETRRSTDNFAEYLEGFVERYSYRNMHCGCRADRVRSGSSAFEVHRRGSTASSDRSAISQANQGRGPPGVPPFG